jgi:hypothetical protein
MFFDINKNLCDTFAGLDPIKLLDYPAEDVFELINGLMDYNVREKIKDARNSKRSNNDEVIRVRASDNWF